jgi:hypothetical protein
MNEKAPEEAERGSALRRSIPSKKVARRPGTEMMWPSEYMGQGSRCALAWYAGTERRGGTRPGVCDTTLENRQKFRVQLRHRSVWPWCKAGNWRGSGTQCPAGGCTAENMPPSNTDVGPQEISEKSGGSRSTSFPIDRPAHFATFGILRAKQTLALCDLGVQPKIRPCVYRCKHPEQRGLSHFYLRWRLRRGKRRG